MAETHPSEQNDLLRSPGYLAAIVKAVPQPIFAIDQDGLVLVWNRHAERAFGWAAEEAIGHCLPIVPAEARDEYAALRERALCELSGHEVRWRRRDGAPIVLSLSTSLVRDDAGAVLAIVVVATDITAERAREREALLSIAGALRQARTRVELLPALLEQTRVLLGADSAALAVRDPTTGDTAFELGLGAWEELGKVRMPPGVSVTGRVIATGELYHSDDVQSDPSFIDPRLHHGVRAAVCAPLRADDTIIGALWAGRQTPLSAAEARLVVAIADLAANAIHKATLSEQTERRLRHLVGLRAIDQAITGSFDMRLSLNVLLDQTLQQLGVDAAAV
ncbi:MAG: PAS domain S-box protein, partial [Chloroflexales bacterium]|nr:PAS domain S-box protein [Chloroflexales bacterium]